MRIELTDAEADFLRWVLETWSPANRKITKAMDKLEDQILLKLREAK